MLQRHTAITAVWMTSYNREECLLIPMISDMFNIITDTQLLLNTNTGIQYLLLLCLQILTGTGNCRYIKQL